MQINEKISLRKKHSYKCNIQLSLSSISSASFLEMHLCKPFDLSTPRLPYVAGGFWEKFKKADVLAHCWQQSIYSCPPAAQQIKKMWNKCTIRYDLALKEDEGGPSPCRWPQQEFMTFCELSHAGKPVICLFTFVDLLFYIVIWTTYYIRL